MMILAFEPAEKDAAESDNEETPSFRGTPFSGNERNRLFMRRGDNFEDMTLVSGMDFTQDGRGFAVLDFDRDGWLDLAIVSPNEPRLRLLKNEIGKRSNSASAANKRVQLKLVGGNQTAMPSADWSPRDPFGAQVLVTTGATKRVFQLSCGEGLSSQNANEIHVALGDQTTIDRVEVRWPSGKKSLRENLAAGAVMTLYEDESMNE